MANIIPTPPLRGRAGGVAQGHSRNIVRLGREIICKAAGKRGACTRVRRGLKWLRKEACLQAKGRKVILQGLNRLRKKVCLRA